MDLGTDWAPVFQHHDLMVEIGRVELAIDHLSHRSEPERAALAPRLESHMVRLRTALDRLVV